MCVYISIQQMLLNLTIKFSPSLVPQIKYSPLFCGYFWCISLRILNILAVQVTWKLVKLLSKSVKFSSYKAVA